MRSFDEAFRLLIDDLGDDELSEHLEDAARALASMDRSTARSISSTHVVRDDEVTAARAVASAIAARHGLGVSFEQRISLRVRFSR